MTVAVVVLPFLLGIATAVVVELAVTEPASSALRFAWWIGALALAGIVFYGSGRFFRRALPLAVLLKMDLSFPAEAPNRLSVAWRAAKTKDLKRHLTQARSLRLVQDPVTAVEHVVALAAALSAHDRRTRGHAERVRALTELVGYELGLSHKDRNGLRWAAMLHDIGKMAVHPGILNKQGALSSGERELLRRHPTEGAKLTAPLHDWLGDWAHAVEQHHERHDGSGYPLGLEGDDISLGGRIVAVVDAYDAMTVSRSQNVGSRASAKALSANAARAEIARCSGTQFDPVVVRAFLAVPPKRLRGLVPLAWVGSLPFGITAPDVAMIARSAAVVLAVFVVAGLTSLHPWSPENGQNGVVALVAPSSDQQNASNGAADAFAGSQAQSASGSGGTASTGGTTTGGSSNGSADSLGATARGFSTPVTTLSGGVAELVNGLVGNSSPSSGGGSSPGTDPPSPGTSVPGSTPPTTGGGSPPTTRGGSPPTTKPSPPTTKPTSPPTTKPSPPTTKPTSPPTTKPSPPTTKPTSPPTTGHSAPAAATGLNGSSSCTDIVIGPSVSLGWNDSTSSWVTGYEILRSTNGSSYSEIGSVGSGSSSYTDNSVQGLGMTYWYEIVAVSGSGNTTSGSISVETPLTCV